MSDSSAVQWEDPPPPKRPQRDWAAIADQLRSRPGQWARLADFTKRPTATTVASRISNGLYVPLRPAGKFEGAARRVGEGFAVFARYVGEGEVSR